MEDVYEYQASISGITSVQYEHSGKLFAIATINGDIFIIDMKTFSTVGFFDLSPGPITQLAWGHDLSSIYVGDGKGSLIKLDFIEKTPITLLNGTVPVTCISSCRTQFGIAAGLANGQILFLSNSSMQLRKFQAHDVLISSICFHDCGFILISADINGYIRIWDLTNLKCQKSSFIENSLINSLSLSNKQDLLLALSTSKTDDQGKLTLFSLPNLEKISSFDGFKSGRILAQCGFTSEIRQEVYVFAPTLEGSVFFWKIGQKDKNLAASCEAQEKPFVAASSSPNGPFLVTGGGPSDGFFRVFKIHMNEISSDESADE